MAYDSTSLWSRRMHNSKMYFDNWHSTFKCDQLERYYENFQWKGKADSQSINYNPYSINLFYTTIKIKLANLLFQKPAYILSPRPGNSQWDMDFAVQSSNLKQDVLNTIIQNHNTHFVSHTKLAALDSFFRFGIMEVGYAADWRNPQKEPPLLKSWKDGDIQESQDKVIDDNEVPVNERFYVKRINPKSFRVGVSESTDLSDHEWCGYWEWRYTNQLRKTKGIKWPADAPDGSFTADYSGFIGPSVDGKSDTIQLAAAGSISKVWHIFDNVAHIRCLYLDNYWDKPLWEGENERLPILDLRWDFRTEGFYPIPPCFQWLSPQDEINEAREQTRSYRRRFTRKFQAVIDTVSEEEKEKFASGPDGIIITVKQANAISPIENPDQGHTAETALVLAKEDFTIISGTSAEARPGGDRETATKSRIADQRANIRESAEQMDFSNFMCRIGREILVQAQEKLANGLWVSYTSNPSEGLLQDMQVNAPKFRYITAQEISDGYDFDIDVDIQNATPAAMAQAQQSFMTFVSMIQNFPMLAMSPLLIRETAYRAGYRNENVIQQMQQAAVLSMAAKAAQQAAATGQTVDKAALGLGGGNNVAKEQIAQEASPAPAQIEQQIQNQLTQ